MGDEMRVDPSLLRSEAPRFDRCAQDLAYALNMLRGSIEAEGPSWGGDAAGTTFASAYVPEQDGALTALAALVDSFAAIGGGLRDTASEFEVTDGDFSRSLGGTN
ncbi:WXG100 family type VII secretion target [Rhodococcus sp. ACT016]|uniref:WXG100 family type VII secretion target n=1 Tax=Rhodococcus sp. ACT016 TaxID=3134808 RepID=UPI003D29765C